MGTRVVINDKGIDQRSTDGTSTLEVNVPLSLNSTATIGGLSVMGVNSASGAIQTLTLTGAGAGATNGYYSQQALTGGTGTGATADITVAGNVVTALALRNPGTGYTAGNVLSCATIGGAGFVFTVSAVSASDNASGNFSAVRVGANRPSPVAPLDVRGVGRIGAAGILNSTNFNSGVLPSLQVITPYLSQLVIDSNYETGTVTSGQNDTVNAALVVAPEYTTSSAVAGGPNLYGAFVQPLMNGLTAAGTNFLWGVYSTPYYVGADTGKSMWVIGVGANPSIGGAVSALNTYSLIRAVGVLPGVSSTNPITVSSVQQFDAQASFRNAAHVISDFKGLRLRTPTLANGATITSAVGIQQDYTAARNILFGNTGVGVDPGAGKIIASLTLTNGGTGYTNATYSQVALTTVTGTGAGATADIIVAGGIVTTVVLRAPGQGYAVGDTLSCASIGAGANFLLTVATTASIVRSDGTVVGSRIGAGTTSPRAGVDVATGGILITSSETIAQVPYVGATQALGRAGAQVLGAINQSAADSFVVGVNARIWSDVTAATAPLTHAMLGYSSVSASTAGQSSSAYGGVFSADRNAGADLATAGNVLGVSGLAQISTGVGAASTSTATGCLGNVQNNVAGHNITNGYAVRASLGATGNFTNLYAFRIGAISGAGTITNFYGLQIVKSTAPTITNRWGVSQEDDAANNVFAGKSAMGQAAGTVATALADVGASTTARASLRVRVGVAPTSPNDGDIWYDGSFLYMRVGASTLKFTLAP